MMQVMELGRFVTRFDDLVGPFTTHLSSEGRLTVLYIVSFDLILFYIF